MWTPTHVQVTVLQARNLIPKGKAGKNDAYVTIQLGKEKYQTSVKEKAEQPEWFEECDLPIPDKSSAYVQLSVFHRSFLKLDEFLGYLSLPLSDFPIYERPRSKWYSLKGKPTKKHPDEKYRGEIEVKITFIVQSKSSSEVNLSRIGRDKRLGSLKSLHGLGDKLKLPTRSNSFGKSEKKPATAIVEPLVASQSPNNPELDTSSKPDDSPEPIFKTTPMRPSNLAEARRFSASTPRLTENSLFAVDVGSERSVDGVDAPPSKEASRVSPPQTRGSPVINHHLQRIKLSDFNHDTPSDEGNNEDESSGKVKEAKSEGQRPRSQRDGFDLAKLPWSPEDSPKTHCGEELTRFDRTRQPILRSSGRMKRRPNNEGDSSGETRRTSTSDATETPLLTDVQDMSHVQSIVQEEDHPYSSSSSPDWREARRERLDSGKGLSSHSIPESIPEVKEPDQVDSSKKSDVKPRPDKDKILERKDSRRHTLHTDLEIKKAATHVLHQSIMQSHRPTEECLPPEILEHFDDYTKEVNDVVLNDNTRVSPVKSDENIFDVAKQNKEKREPVPEEKEEPTPKVEQTVKEVEQKETDPEPVEVQDTTTRETVDEYPMVSTEDIIITDSKTKENSLPAEVTAQFADCSREDLIRLVLTQRDQLGKKDTYIQDLENYIDNLLVRVITNTPRLLQNPFQRGNNSANSTPSHTANNRNNQHNTSVTNNKQSYSQTSTPTKKGLGNPFKKTQPTRN